MKTNHNRNYVAKSYPHRIIKHYTKIDRQLGVSFSARVGNDYTNGHRGEAKARKGAKHFINSRLRRVEREKLIEIEKEKKSNGLL
jgi:hypothetical protein